MAVSLGNNPAFATLTYAIFKLGAILVPLNPAFTTAQVAAALNHLEARILIIGAVTDLPYKPCNGRSNLPLLRELVPNLEPQPRQGVESPMVPCLRDVIIVDNSIYHPSIDFQLSNYEALTPMESLCSESNLGRGIIPDQPLHPSDIINIQFTSGTTSQPKAAQLSHTSILNNGALIANRMRLTPTDKICCPPPLFHCFGSVLGYMATATTGAALLLPSPAFDPTATLEMVIAERATGLYGVATMFVAVLDVLAKKRERLAESSDPESSQEDAFLASKIAALPTHLRTGIAAGSSVPSALMQRLFENLGMEELVICYGMTETAPVSCMTSPDDPLERRTGSVGRAMPHTQVKVVDPADRSRVLPRGERGEFAASGYLVMKGYWDDHERTDEVRVFEADEEQAEDGLGADPTTVVGSDGKKGRVWVYSGDEARMDEDGYVEITGRIKDLIIRGGENIHPLEIENCLFQHPLIAEASVVGVPDERHGEVVGAFIIVRDGVLTEGIDGTVGKEGLDGRTSEKVLTGKEVRDWVKAKLSGHLVPKYVFRIEEYPKTASGKIQKFKLRDLAKELLSGSQR